MWHQGNALPTTCPASKIRRKSSTMWGARLIAKLGEQNSSTYGLYRFRNQLTWGVTHCTWFHYNHKSMFNLGCNCMYNFASNIHSKSIFLWLCMWSSSTICIGSPLLAVSSLAPLPDSRQPGAHKRVRSWWMENPNSSSGDIVNVQG